MTTTTRRGREYAEYAAKNTNNTQQCVVTSYQEIMAVMATLPRIQFTYQARCNGSGRYDGTFRNLDGQILEVWRSEFTGAVERIVIWENQEKWNAHRSPLPWNIYFWG